jgi:hypothetical protein
MLEVDCVRRQQYTRLVIIFQGSQPRVDSELRKIIKFPILHAYRRMKNPIYIIITIVDGIYSIEIINYHAFYSFVTKDINLLCIVMFFELSS